MKAWQVYALGLGAYVVGRWARNKNAIPSAGQVGGAIFVLFVLDLADTGQVAPVAKGFAWLFTATALVTSIGPTTKNLGTAAKTPSSTTA